METIQYIILGTGKVIRLQNRKQVTALGISIFIFTGFVIMLRMLAKKSGVCNKESTRLIIDVLTLICMVATWVLGFVFRKKAWGPKEGDKGAVLSSPPEQTDSKTGDGLREP